jgi:hypothetical protein
MASNINGCGTLTFFGMRKQGSYIQPVKIVASMAIVRVGEESGSSSPARGELI